MAILQNPFQTPNPAYRPIQWELKVTDVNVVERCIPVITVNGTAYTLPPLPYDPDLSSGNDYYFLVDAQTLVQQELAPQANFVTSTIFGDFNQPYQAVNADMFATVSISVTYLYRDPATNLLTPLGVTDTSTDYYAINSAPQHDEAQDYEDYKPLFNDTTQKWLTKTPINSNIALTDNAWVTFLSHSGGNGADRIRVISYNAAGGVIDTGLFVASLVANFPPQTVAVGPANLVSQIWASGTVDFTDPALAYYTVELYSPFFASPYLAVRTYTIVEPCAPESMRLHWLGLLGGAECYTFTAFVQKNISTTNTFAQKPLYWDVTLPQHYITDKGAYKIASEGETRYTLTSDFIENSEADFLASLLTSPEVYVETTAGLLPCVVETTEQNLRRSDGTRLIQFVVTIRLANNIISQTN